MREGKERKEPGRASEAVRKVREGSSRMALRKDAGSWAGKIWH